MLVILKCQFQKRLKSNLFLFILIIKKYHSDQESLKIISEEEAKAKIFYQSTNSIYCKRKKIYRENFERIANKLFSIEFIWSILLDCECLKKESMLKIN